MINSGASKFDNEPFDKKKGWVLWSYKVAAAASYIVWPWAGEGGVWVWCVRGNEGTRGDDVWIFTLIAMICWFCSR